MWERPAAAVADVLDDGRERVGRARRHVQPAADRLAAVAAERDIERLDRAERRLMAVERRLRRPARDAARVSAQNRSKSAGSVTSGA